MFLVLGAFALAACGETKLDVDRSTATTVSPTGLRRFWAITADGVLTSLLPRVDDPGAVDWSVIPNPGSTTVTSGVAGLTWGDFAGHHERAYFVQNTDTLLARAIDDGVVLGTHQVAAGTQFNGPIAAVGLSSLRFVGATTSQTPPTIEVYGTISQDDAYSLHWQCMAPAGTGALGALAAAMPGTDPCFFAGSSGPSGLFVCRQGSAGFITAPAGVSLSGPVAAAARSGAAGPVVEAFARADDGRVWRAEWNGSCVGEPVWSDFGRPDGGVVATRAALAAVAYSGTIIAGGTDVRVIAATSDGKLSMRSYTDAGGWMAWTLRAAVSDTIGPLGGLHLAPPAPDDLGSGPQPYFVGQVSPAADGVPAAYAFTSHAGKIVDYTDPSVGLQSVGTGAPFAGVWTESALAERGGHIVVASHLERKVDGDPGRVAVAFSRDDGHRWTHQLIDPQYAPPSKKACPAGEGCHVLQGDPTVAFDSNGTGWVLFHELYEQDVCQDRPLIYASQIWLASTDGVSLTGYVSDEDWLYEDFTKKELGAPAFLDHPSLVITSDDVQHFVWWKTYCTWPDSCPPGLDVLLYRSRKNGKLSKPVVISSAQGVAGTGVPSIVADKAGNTFIYWTSGGHLQVGHWLGKHWYGGIVNATKLVDGCAAVLQDVQWKSSPAMFVRSGGAALAAVQDVAGHLVAAFQAEEGTIANANCNPSKPPFDIAVIESKDFGQTWSLPTVITTFPQAPGTAGAQGTDQFMPSVTSDENGSVFVTYYDRSPVPTGSLVRHMVGVRRAGETQWQTYERRPRDSGNPFSDLALLPQKCGEYSNYLFLGDYQTAIGGKTHVHALRMDAQAAGAAPDVVLEASALSVSSPR